MALSNTRVSPALCLGALGLGLLALTPAANAVILAHDSFDYADGSSLAGQNGGAGFNEAQPWTVAPTVTQSIQNGAVVLGSGGTNNPNNSPTPFGIQRYFSPGAHNESVGYNGDVFFLKYTFSTATGTLKDADRFYVILTGLGDSGGWGTIEIGSGLNHALASTTSGATADSHLTVRTNSTNSGGMGRRSSAGVVAEGIFAADQTVYTIVVELSKVTPGAAGKYGAVKAWLTTDGAALDYETPLFKGTLSSKQTVSMVNRIHFRVDETDEGDQYLLHEVTLATTWEEVAAPGIPEPSSLTLSHGP